MQHAAVQIRGRLQVSANALSQRQRHPRGRRCVARGRRIRVAGRVACIARLGAGLAVSGGRQTGTSLACANQLMAT